MAKNVHLICNAHLDPVWLWSWEDGCAEALATFRIAADFGETHRDFVFNHNEALLYRWVEHLDPALFTRIQKLVDAGKWHIAGGSYLQPDLNAVSGESHIRQFLYGLDYFREKFHHRPTTAYNFDSFGQPEGYVQLLAGCGFDSYLFCRPVYGTVPLPVGCFRWTDRSGLSITARRCDEMYPTNESVPVEEKLKKWLHHYHGEKETLLLWGIGNHGGGVSKKEYEAIIQFQREHPEFTLIHSTPERFFASVVLPHDSLPTVAGEMQNCFPGCYTSMSRVKRGHRLLEDMVQRIERIASRAWWMQGISYPTQGLAGIWRDILFSEFHDILPGSAIQSAERDALNCMGRAEENCRRLRMQLLAAMFCNTKTAAGNRVPLFITNPHGFAVEKTVEIEYQIDHIGFFRGSIDVYLLDERSRCVPVQREKEEANLLFDWRVKISFPVRLKPFETRRMEAGYRGKSRRCQWQAPKIPTSVLSFQTPYFRLDINTKTGLIDRFSPDADSPSLLKTGALQPVSFGDLSHSWTTGAPGTSREYFEAVETMTALPWGKPAGRFRLASLRDAFRIVSPPNGSSRVKRQFPPVTILEQGPVRTVIECIFSWKNSVIVRHYIVTENEAVLEIRDRIFWNEKDTMLKMKLPLAYMPKGTIAESPSSAIFRPVPPRHIEYTNQRWVAAIAQRNRPCIAFVNNGLYAHSIYRTTLYASILRSPAYASFNLSPSHDIHSRRFLPRQDQGEHVVRYGLYAGKKFYEPILHRHAALFSMGVDTAVWYGGGAAGSSSSRFSQSFLRLAPSTTVIVAVKKAEQGEALIVRVQELAGKNTTCRLGVAGSPKPVVFLIEAYRLKTLRIEKKSGGLSIDVVNLVEQEIS